MAPGLAIQTRVRAASGQSSKSTPPSTRSGSLRPTFWRRRRRADDHAHRHEWRSHLNV